MYTFKPEDYEQNLFFELKKVGMEFDSRKYEFTTKSKEVEEKAKDIINFYNEPYKLMTKAHRKLRDNVQEKFNLDIIAKRIENKLYLCNTNGIGDLVEIKKFVEKSKYKVLGFINENRIIIDLGIDNL